MWKKIAVTVGILAGLILIGYLLAMLPAGPEQNGLSSVTTAIATNQDRSWLGDMNHAWKVTRPKDDGIRREGSNQPDADTSECQWYNLSSDQMITTRFAGHILRYPCTANHDGRSLINHNQANEVIYQSHALYLTLLVERNKESIWRSSSSDYSSGQGVYRVKLISNGQNISNEPIQKWINDAIRIAEFENINTVVFLKDHTIRGFLIDAMNQEGGFPNMMCNGSTAERALKIFDPKLTDIEPGDCDLLWNLNDSIRVRIQLSDTSFARDFGRLYQKIDQGLRDIIIKEPNGITSSNQEN